MRPLVGSFGGLLLLSPVTASELLSNSTVSSLKWGECTAHDPPNLSCAQLSVPINWDSPNGENVTLTIARLAATEKKVGNMFFNPGGPGVSAVSLFYEIAELVQGNQTFFPPQYDIIGPDPRGIGYSHPLKCDADLWNKNINFQPSNEAGFQQMVANNRAVGQSCRKLTGPVFDYLDSRSVARDFEAIRAALGEEKMTYLGISYGTIIGQAYAELFPEKIRAFALDGNLDHSLDASTQTALLASSLNNVFEVFAAWCRSTPDNALHGTNVIQLWKKLAAKAPLPAPSCKKSGQCQPNVSLYNFVNNFQSALVFENPPAALGLPSWYDAAETLKQAAGGDASNSSLPLATNSSSPLFYGSGYQTLCLDWNPIASTFSGLQTASMMSNNSGPLLFGITGLGLVPPRCIGWPAPVQYTPNLTQITGVPPFLLTNAYHDPETPYAEAASLSARINGSVLATRNGNGHTSYFLLGETWAAINKYLVTLETPAPNTVFNS